MALIKGIPATDLSRADQEWVINAITSATDEVEDLAERVENATTAAQAVLSSIPNDYSALSADVAALDQNNIDYGTVDLLTLYPSQDRTTYGITYTKNNDGTWTITGTAASAAFVTLLTENSPYGTYLKAGRSYLVRCDSRVGVQVLIYDPSLSEQRIYGSGIVKISETTSKIVVRLVVSAGEDFTTPETVTVSLHAIPDGVSSELESNDTSTQSETGKFDRKNSITLMLQQTGYCKLGSGIFYVTPITMPDGSMLEGSGSDTIIRLLGTETGAAITMGKNCTISNMTIDGSYTNVTVSGTIGSRDGIVWTSVTAPGIIECCTIKNFNGAGIRLYETSTPVDQNLMINNCFISKCDAGIYIQKNSEYNKIVNCTISECYYGILNRGGNNNISNCGIDSNTIGIQVDADEGSNNGHGAITGCSINHSASNNGYGLIIKDTGRMLVTGCNFYYSKILLNNTNGNIITGCGFGQNTAWEITDGDCSIFNGCMLRTTTDTPITVTNNTTYKIVNCYTRGGAEVTA